MDFSQQSAARKWNSFIIRSMRPLPKTTCWIAVLLALAVTCGCDRGSSTDMVGKSAPDFTVQDSDRTVSLHELHGKVIVLNFWATWCPPCIQEMPSLVAMQSQLKDRVNVLAVSVDQNPETYHRFLRLYGVNLLKICSRSAIRNKRAILSTERKCSLRLTLLTPAASSGGSSSNPWTGRGLRYCNICSSFRQ